jgi:hypothetical protein
MMLMLYALLVALSLVLWAALNLRGRRAIDLPHDHEVPDRGAGLPPVPAVFAAKPAPAPEVHGVQTQATRALGRDGRPAGEWTGGESTAHGRREQDATVRAPRPPETPTRDASPPSEGRASRTKIRVVPHREEGAPAKPERERDDAFERFRTAKDDIDF